MRAMAAAAVQVATAAPRCALPVQPARPARERCPLACAGVARRDDGSTYDAAQQLPVSEVPQDDQTAGVWPTVSSNLHGSFGAGSGWGAE